MWMQMLLALVVALSLIDIAYGVQYYPTMGACRKGKSPDNSAGLQFYENRDCEATCNADAACSGYVLPVSNSNWCETYTSFGASGDGRNQFRCFMKADPCTTAEDIEGKKFAIIARTGGDNRYYMYKIKVGKGGGVTQYQTTYPWESWKLGNFVSRDGLVENYDNGDECGQTPRRSKVTFTFGDETKMLSASEPSTCYYVFSVQIDRFCQASLCDGLRSRKCRREECCIWNKDANTCGVAERCAPENKNGFWEDNEPVEADRKCQNYTHKDREACLADGYCAWDRKTLTCSRRNKTNGNQCRTFKNEDACNTSGCRWKPRSGEKGRCKKRRVKNE